MMTDECGSLFMVDFERKRPFQTCYALATIVCLFAALQGCTPVHEGSSSWEMTIVDRKGRVLLVSIPLDEMSRPRSRHTTKEFPGIVSASRDAWHDPESGMLASRERNATGQYNHIRVYDVASTTVLFDHELTNRRVASMSLSPGGAWVAVVDEEQHLLVAAVNDQASGFHTVCHLPDAGHISSQPPLQWISSDSLIVAGNEAIYAVNVDSGESRRLEDRGAFLGLVGQSAAYYEPFTFKVVLVDLENNQAMVRGRIRHQGSYSGSWVEQISPNGTFVAYEHPELFGWAGTSLVLEELKTGRCIRLKGFAFPIWLGSWTTNTPRSHDGP